jgi:hypothetical protein
MREFVRANRTEAIFFVACLVIYGVLVFAWNLSGLADSDISFIRGTAVPGTTVRQGALPVIGELPAQSISKLFITTTLYLLALVYAVLAVGASPYRRALPQIVGFAALSFVAWVALNFWVIAGFLNAPNVLVYGGIAIVLLVVWGGGLMRFVAREHDAIAVFMVRFGLGLALFITIVQILITLSPNWRSPTQGVPVLYTMTLNALVGMIIAGVGGNMLWRERREQVLAAGARRR